jgi:hypothetical protein
MTTVLGANDSNQQNKKLNKKHITSCKQRLAVPPDIRKEGRAGQGPFPSST